MLKKLFQSIRSPLRRARGVRTTPEVLGSSQHPLHHEQISRNAVGVVDRLQRAGYQAYLVGGCVRDLLLGLEPKDFDVATFFLNLFFHAKLSGMPPKLLSDDGKHVVIRPLAYVREADIEAYAEAKGFPIIPCNLCGSQENLQRKQVKKMLAQWEKETPGRIETIARALGDIRPSQLSDPKLFDFLSLGRRGDAALPDAHAWLAGAPDAPEPVAMALHPVRNHDGLDILKS